MDSNEEAKAICLKEVAEAPHRVLESRSHFARNLWSHRQLPNRHFRIFLRPRQWLQISEYLAVIRLAIYNSCLLQRSTVEAPVSNDISTACTRIFSRTASWIIVLNATPISSLFGFPTRFCNHVYQQLLRDYPKVFQRRPASFERIAGSAELGSWFFLATIYVFWT